MPKKPKGEPPTTTCNAKVRNGLCDEPAGMNTAHAGYGRCWKHGGTSIVPGTGQQLMLPSQQQLREFVKNNQNDPDVFNLRREIALSRGVSEHVQNLLIDEEDLDVVNGLLRTLNQFIQTTGKLVAKAHEIENGKRYIISVEDVKKVINDIVDIISEEIDDPELQTRVLQRVLNQQVNGPIIAPPDSYRYADAWHEANDPQPVTHRDKGEEIVHRVRQAIDDPVPVDVPERLSFKEYRRDVTALHNEDDVL